jgi:hypothetical protein
VAIVPKKEGTIQITVQDIELPLSESATAILHISDVASLQLHSKVHLIEQNDEMNVTITAKDFHGFNFDEDQYKKMVLEIQTEMTGVHNKDDMHVEKIPSTNRVFKIRGKEPGIYRLTAFIE